MSVLEKICVYSEFVYHSFLPHFVRVGHFGFQTEHVSGWKFFSEILVEGTKRGDSMFCGCSVGGTCRR